MQLPRYKMANQLINNTSCNLVVPSNRKSLQSSSLLYASKSNHARNRARFTVSAAIKQAPHARGIHNNATEIVGNTPMVKLNRVNEMCVADIYCKLELMEPCRSVKDRIALAMIQNAEAAGRISPEKTILVEPTSGNTGVGLAYVAACKVGTYSSP